MDEATKVDRSETRRLCYMALVGVEADVRPGLDLVGTLVNALTHHSCLLSQSDAVALGAALLKGEDPVPPGLETSGETLLRLIDALTADLAE